MPKIPRLRPHHLGCVAGFTGHGYDTAFTTRLAAIARRLEADPAGEILVVSGGDDVCLPCPHRDGSRCVRDPGAQERVLEHDRVFLLALGLKVGDRTSLAEIRDRLRQDPEARAQVLAACSSCSWTRVCRFFRDLRTP